MNIVPCRELNLERWTQNSLLHIWFLREFTLYMAISFINRQLHWRHRSDVTERIIEIKHNSYCSRSESWTSKSEDIVNSHPFFSIHESTGSFMRETGITSLSESLKINTSLLKLFLRGLHTNQMRTGYQSTNHLWIPKHTGNSIGTKSAESMREALETNTTLTELHLDCENEINRR